MSTPVEPWPANGIDRSRDLRARLGTFWSRVFAGRDTLLYLLESVASAANRLEDRWKETLACRGGVDVPQTTREPAIPLLLDPTTAELDSRANGRGRDPLACLRYAKFTEPITDARLITDAPLAPTVIRVAGSDFDITDNRLTLLDSPTATDWLIAAALDSGPGRLATGYLVNRNPRPTASGNQHALVRALLDASINGPAELTVRQAIAALCDIPCIRNESETVEYLVEESTRKLVITDKEVYRFPSTVNLSVTVGENLAAGDFLCDAVQVWFPPHRTVPAALDLLQLPASWLDPSLTGPLTFENSDKALTVTTNVSGYTKLTWSMPDDPSAVTAFFNLLHTRGVTATKTLADWLDLRTPPQTTKPTAASLPTTINPLSLLLTTVFRNRVIAVRVESNKLGTGAVLADRAVLQRCLPAGTSIAWRII